MPTRSIVHVAAGLGALALAAAGPVAAGAAVDAGAALAADERFQAFSTSLYQRLTAATPIPRAESLESLAALVQEHRRHGRMIEAVAAIVANLPLVEQNADVAPIVGICETLFEANERDTAMRVYQRVHTQGDRALVSGVSLALARHRFDRHQWAETVALVETLRSDLAPEDYHHALLLHGIALQQLRRHRAALDPYSRIPRTSRYYRAARLNMAVASLRQDWWTDAHAIITELLSDRSPPGTALTDRLYTVLGYSLLRQQYFRQSREAFRSVSVEGPYASQALLGIALNAAFQEDYIGALNAVGLLKERPRRDLPADEAILLEPYFHERLRQPLLARTGYAGAISHFERRLLQIRAAMPDSPAVLMNTVVAANSSSVVVNGEFIDLGEKLPPSVFTNVRLLAQAGPHVHRLDDAALTREFEAVQERYRALLQTAVAQLLEERARQIDHYLSQSRYGLARMQDHDVVAPK